MGHFAELVVEISKLFSGVSTMVIPCKGYSDQPPCLRNVNAVGKVQRVNTLPMESALTWPFNSLNLYLASATHQPETVLKLAVAQKAGTKMACPGMETWTRVRAVRFSWFHFDPYPCGLEVFRGGFPCNSPLQIRHPPSGVRFHRPPKTDLKSLEPPSASSPPLERRFFSVAWWFWAARFQIPIKPSNPLWAKPYYGLI